MLLTLTPGKNMEIKFEIRNDRRHNFNIEEEYVGWDIGKFSYGMQMISAFSGTPCLNSRSLVRAGITNSKTGQRYLLDGYIVSQASIDHVDFEWSSRTINNPMVLHVARIYLIEEDEYEADEEEIPDGASPNDYYEKKTFYIEMSIPLNLRVKVHPEDIIEELVPAMPWEVSEVVCSQQ